MTSIKEHLEQMSKEHGGDHLHAMGHEGGYTVHKVSEGKKATGPHEVSTLGGVIGHLRDTMEGE